jgi:hypothetical protein
MLFHGTTSLLNTFADKPCYFFEKSSMERIVEDTEMVPKGGFEPPQACARRSLKPVRLPIPPLRHRWLKHKISNIIIKMIWGNKKLIDIVNAK